MGENFLNDRFPPPFRSSNQNRELPVWVDSRLLANSYLEPVDEFCIGA